MSRGSINRSVRVPPEEQHIWDQAREIAEARGSSLSEEIRRFVKRYVQRAQR